MIKRPTNKQLNELIEEVDSKYMVDSSACIMEKIKSGNVKMKSRWLVLTEYLGIRTTWLVLLLLLAMVVNIIVYMISRTPEWQFFGFGTSAFGLIIYNMPFAWISTGIAMLVILIVVMRSFSWTYVASFKFYVFMLMLGVLLAGTVTFASGINDKIYVKLVEEPGAGSSLLAKWYCMCANRISYSDKVLLGEVIFRNHSDFMVQTSNLEMVSVEFTDNTVWSGQNSIDTLQVVKMLGQRDGNEFIATHVFVSPQKNIRLYRSEEDCVDEEKWQDKKQILNDRRQVAQLPLVPIVGHSQLANSIR